MTVESAAHDDAGGTGATTRGGWAERIGSDWWAVIVGGAVTVLAVADLLPKIPW